jgi:hypothetical protein
VKRFRWPVRASDLSSMRDRLLFDRKSSPLVGPWARRQLLGGTTPSCDQERRLLTEEWTGQRSVIYQQPHLVMAFGLAPFVSARAVQQALDSVVSRHRALRTLFGPVTAVAANKREQDLGRAYQSGVSVGGFYERKTVSRVSVPLTERRVEVAECSPFTGAVCDLIADEANKPFATDRPPLMRAVIVEGAADQSLLVVVADRLVADWASMALLRSELERPYGDSSVVVHEIPLVPVSRKDRRRLTRGGMRAMAYWRDRWSDSNLLTCDDLPFALPHSELGVASFESRAITVPAQVTVALRHVAVSHGEALDIVLLSAVVAMLHHATHKMTLSIWTDFRSVARPELRSEMGPFSNSHIVTIELAKARSIWDIVRRVRQALSDVGSHHEIPLDMLWRATSTCSLPRMGQVSFQHLAFMPAPQKGRPLITRAWPFLETDQSMTLQFRSCDDGVDVSICAAFLKSRLRTESVDGLLADVLDVLLAIGSAADHGRPRSPVEKTDRGTRSSLVDVTLVTGTPADCYLCTCRERRRQQHPDARVDAHL